MSLQKIIVAVTGASGSIYAKVLLDKLVSLQGKEVSTTLIMSETAKQIWEHELDNREFENLPFVMHSRDDLHAPCASGSNDFATMIVIPCSMGTLGRVASGFADDLITRSADVMLKERRRLILVTRETPLNLIHIRNMETITLAGGIICPASPSFYSKPDTVKDIVNTVVERVLQLGGVPIDGFRWNG
jgi:flavin prenyltransferase